MNTQSPNDPPATEKSGIIVDIRRITQSQLGQLGVAHVAYVKPVVTQSGPAFAIHAADGEPLALAANQDLAFAAVVQQEMTPVLVH